MTFYKSLNPYRTQIKLVTNFFRIILSADLLEAFNCEMQIRNEDKIKLFEKIMNKDE